MYSAGHGVQEQSECRVLLQVPRGVVPEVPAPCARRWGRCATEGHLGGGGQRDSIGDPRDGGDAGPRALVCECVTAMECGGTGQRIEERVMGPVHERVPGDERNHVGRSLVEFRVFCASNRRQSDLLCDSAVHSAPTSKRR